MEIMKIKDIRIGDIVRVNFNNSQFTLCDKAKVLNIPHQTGESWQFLDVKNNKVHYVSEGCTISFIERP